MKTTFDILYAFFALFNVLVAGICIGRILASSERRSKQSEKTGSAAPAFIVVKLCSGDGGWLSEVPAPPGCELPRKPDNASGNSNDADNNSHN